MTLACWSATFPSDNRLDHCRVFGNPVRWHGPCPLRYRGVRVRGQSIGKPVGLGVGMGEGRWALVAADDSEFQLSLRRELAELSERLLTVRSGRDCLRAIEDRRVHFVVLDSSLSDVSGAHLVHLVQQIRPDVGVVLAFARSDQAQECEVRQAGVLFYGDRSATRDIASVLRKGMSSRRGDGSGAGRAGVHKNQRP